MGNRRIVVIGGGTGTFPVLTGLKQYTDNITAVVTMMDSGGSSGRLRDEFGQLPPGDVRQALVALSNDTSIMRELFNYRYSKGEGLEGHSFGNLFLTALSEVSGGMDRALEETKKILNIKGKVLPVTLSKADLVAEFEDGSTVRGEGNIDEPKHDGKLQIVNLKIDPAVTPYEPTLEAIRQAEIIVIGPGDLYTSLVPNLLVPKVAEAICSSSAKKVFIMNLMTKFGQTYKFKASDFLAILEKYLGKCLDHVLVNNRAFPVEVIERYKAENDMPVEDDLVGNGYEIIRNDFLATDPIEKKAGDVLKRSFIRHDSDKLAQTLVKI